MPAQLTEALAARISAATDAPVHAAPPLPLASAARVHGTAYDADALLDLLAAQRTFPDEYTLAITDQPLAAKGFVSVFGEATVGGCCALVSSAGLRAGVHDTEDSVLYRLTIECMHELGHLAGYDHCRDPACVMYPSRSIEDTDRKGPEMCPRCAGSITYRLV